MPKAAELDPDDGEGLYFLGQLQVRAGASPAAKRSFERLIAQGDRVPDENRHWAYFLLGDVEAQLGNLDAALAHYKRGQALVLALAARDPDNAGWQRDLALSFGRVAQVLARQDNLDEAQSGFGTGRTIVARLQAQSPDNATLPKDLAWFDSQLAQLGRSAAE